MEYFYLSQHSHNVLKLAGTEIHQLACLFCGRNKPLKDGFRLGEMLIEPIDYGIINVRSVGPGPGRGHKGEPGAGLRTIERLNILEALADPRFSDIAEQVRDRLIVIVRSYIENGVFGIDELS